MSRSAELPALCRINRFLARHHPATENRDES